jgi:hypothetical protein
MLHCEARECACDSLPRAPRRIDKSLPQSRPGGRKSDRDVSMLDEDVEALIYE